MTHLTIVIYYHDNEAVRRKAQHNRIFQEDFMVFYDLSLI